MRKIIYSILLGSICISACKSDFLDTSPTDQIGQKIVLNSLDNLYKALNGIHRVMIAQYSKRPCGGEPTMSLYKDTMGDDLVLTNNSSSFADALGWIEHRDPSSGLCLFGFEMYYKFILNANQLLENVDIVPNTDPVLHDGIKGEALCFRAWSHFQLVQLYGIRYRAGVENSQLGVPYRKASSTEAMARNTVEECYAYIHEDLDEAISLLENYKAAAVTHFSLKVAYGIKARVFLTQQNYKDAAEYADLAIQTAEKEGFKLMEGDQLLCGFYNLLTEAKETIWGAHPLEDQSIWWWSYYAFMGWDIDNEREVRCINSNLYETLSETDIRRSWWDPTGEAERPSWVMVSAPYQHRKFKAKEAEITIGDFPYMRLAELYLMKAEALARQGGRDGEAQTTLTTFALTRDPVYTPKSGTNADLIEEIMCQRRIELWGEGFRFTDLKRLNLPLDRTNSNHRGDVSGIMEVAAGDARWEFLVPTSEMNTNSLMVQNP